MAKYNKNLQKKIDISIINYKFFSGKYIIYETKNKGKEYEYNDKLLYEGEFLNGERYGKGKEYENNHIIFEGEYLNGKKWKEKVKIYKKEYDPYFDDYNYSLLREEQFLNGERFYKITDINDKELHDFNNINGIIKEYYDENKLKFEGEYLNRKRNGKGKEYDKDGNIMFKGEYLNGKKENIIEQYLKRYLYNL